MDIFKLRDSQEEHVNGEKTVPGIRNPAERKEPAKKPEGAGDR